MVGEQVKVVGWRRSRARDPQRACECAGMSVQARPASSAVHVHSTRTPSPPSTPLPRRPHLLEASQLAQYALSDYRNPIHQLLTTPQAQ